LQDFIIEKNNALNSKMDKLMNLKRFKGIATCNVVVNEEDWYKQ
jgi:hypothetical protein